MWSIIVACIVGLIIGASARFIMPGRQNLAIWETALIGLVGSFLGSWLVANLFNYQNESGGIAWIPFFAGVAIACLLIFLYMNFKGRANSNR